MRIGIDCRLWNQTGVGRYVKNLTLNLQKIDKRNHYIVFARKQDLEDIKPEITNKNWKIVEANIHWHSLREQIDLPKLLESQYLDLMHFPYFSVPVSYKRPFVITIHDLIMDHFSTGNATTLIKPLYFLKFLGYKYVVSIASKKAKKIISPSFATRDEIIDHLKISKDKIAITKEAVDDKVKDGTFSDPNYKVLDEKYFLYVGNAYPHKNLDRLLDAYLNFQKKFKDVSLVFVGKRDIFYLRLLKKARENGLENKVILYTGVSDFDLSVLYKNALSFCFPSLMEGFGLPVLEAMSNKCPVVSSNIPSVKEIAGESILYFNPKEVEEIERALIYVYKGNYEKTRVENAYKVSKEFSWKKMAEETLEVYEETFVK